MDIILHLVLSCLWQSTRTLSPKKCVRVCLAGDATKDLFGSTMGFPSRARDLFVHCFGGGTLLNLSPGWRTFPPLWRCEALRFPLNSNGNSCRECVEACHLGIRDAIQTSAGAITRVHASCIWDGACLKACPQGAAALRGFHDDAEQVKSFIKNGKKVIASVAPSFVAAFGKTDPMKVVSALRCLGFSHIEETACALEQLIRERARYLAKANGLAISTSCPSVVDLVYKHYPQAVPALIPHPSPMVAHGASLREKYGKDALIVFIGPCLAKKRQVSLMEFHITPEDATDDDDLHEVSRPVDICLTFAELRAWMDESIGDLDPLPQSEWDAEASPDARLGVLQEGISGVDRCRAFLERFVSGEAQEEGGDAPFFVELLACPGGCLNGPGMGDVDVDEMHPIRCGSAEGDRVERLAARRRRVIEYALGRRYS